MNPLLFTCEMHLQRWYTRCTPAHQQIRAKYFADRKNDTAWDHKTRSLAVVFERIHSHVGAALSSRIFTSMDRGLMQSTDSAPHSSAEIKGRDSFLHDLRRICLMGIVLVPKMLAALVGAVWGVVEGSYQWMRFDPMVFVNTTFEGSVPVSSDTKPSAQNPGFPTTSDSGGRSEPMQFTCKKEVRHALRDVKEKTSLISHKKKFATEQKKPFHKTGHSEVTQTKGHALYSKDTTTNLSLMYSSKTKKRRVESGGRSKSKSKLISREQKLRCETFFVEEKASFTQREEVSTKHKRLLHNVQQSETVQRKNRTSTSKHVTTDPFHGDTSHSKKCRVESDPAIDFGQLLEAQTQLLDLRVGPDTLLILDDEDLGRRLQSRLDKATQGHLPSKYFCLVDPSTQNQFYLDMQFLKDVARPSAEFEIKNENHSFSLNAKLQSLSTADRQAMASDMVLSHKIIFPELKELCAGDPNWVKKTSEIVHQGLWADFVTSLGDSWKHGSTRIRMPSNQNHHNDQYITLLRHSSSSLRVILGMRWSPQFDESMGSEIQALDSSGTEGASAWLPIGEHLRPPQAMEARMVLRIDRPSGQKIEKQKSAIRVVEATLKPYQP